MIARQLRLVCAMGMIFGFGINDANYVVYPTINGKQVMCAAYSAWRSMIMRCYSSKRVGKRPTYAGVTVCDEWRSFMAFREWWLENHVDGWHLDKDLLTDNRIYAPENCIYVPSWLNCFNIDNSATRGDNPIGSHFDAASGLYPSQCRNPITGKSEFIGRFKTPLEAHLSWKSKKLEHAERLKSNMDAIDCRIYDRVVEIIKRAS